MAALSSAVIILSFFLLMNLQSVPAEKIRAITPFALSPNAIVLTDYSAGKLITATKIKFESQGFIVVHEDKGGKKGMILGYSKLLPSGESDDVVVGLSRASKDGERLYVSLVLDNGDGKFEARQDTAAKDNFGISVVVNFIVGSGVSY